MVEEVHAELLVPAGVEHGRGAGQLEVAINDTLVLWSGSFQWLPHLVSPVLVAGHSRAALCRVRRRRRYKCKWNYNGGSPRKLRNTQ